MFGLLDRLLYDNTVEEEYYRKIRQKSSSLSAIVVGLVAAVGGFLYGYDTGLINDILEMNYVSTHFPLNGHSFSTHERALVTAMLSLGTFVGAVLAPLLSDTYGRKFSIVVLSGILCNGGNVLQVAASDITLLCIGRVICGIAVGILSASVPLYQAEAAPKWVRGSIVYTYQWAITWGLLIALAVCQGTREFKDSGSYRIPIALQFLWASILCLGMLFLPELPRFYVQKNKIQKGLESLAKLRRLPTDDPDLIEELVEIKANYDYEMLFGKTSLLDCFRNGGGRHKQVLRMTTGIGIHALQQTLGINFIFYYGVNFFSSSGLGNYYLMSFVTYAVNTVFTIPGIILIEVIGRRSLMLWGGVGMAVSNFIIAIVGTCISDDHISAIISVSFSCLFIAFFAASWGGCTWALVSDMYGISIRQKAISITVATNWLVNFICAYITPYLIDQGSHTVAMKNKIFFIWGGFNALGVVFVYFMVYETKGLKLEEIDYMYLNCDNARVSTKFKSQKIDYNSPLLQKEMVSLENSHQDPKHATREPVSHGSDTSYLDNGHSESSTVDSDSESSEDPPYNNLTDYQQYLSTLGQEENKIIPIVPPSHDHDPSINPVIARQFFEAPPSESDSESDNSTNITDKIETGTSHSTY